MGKWSIHARIKVTTNSVGTVCIPGLPAKLGCVFAVWSLQKSFGKVAEFPFWARTKLHKQVTQKTATPVYYATHCKVMGARQVLVLTVMQCAYKQTRTRTLSTGHTKHFRVLFCCLLLPSPFSIWNACDAVLIQKTNKPIGYARTNGHSYRHSPTNKDQKTWSICAVHFHVSY